MSFCRIPSRRSPRFPGLSAAVLATAGCVALFVAEARIASAADWLAGIRAAAEALEWSDERVDHEWRLQRKATGDAWRVLDPRDRVVVLGTREECLATYERLGESGEIPAVTGPTVLVIHGLGEGRQAMGPLVEHLRKSLDATIMTFGYASPRAGIENHARSLASVVDGLPQGTPVSFVGHSLGGIVVRRWMAMAPPDALDRVHRLVMLGSPNQGSELARMASRIWLMSLLAEGAARELAVDWDRVSETLAIPPCDFGIVAGGRGDDRGYTDLLPGDDDAVVRVEEAKLDGADDFLLVPVRHAQMMKHPDVQQATAEFLRSGRFRADGQPVPTP